MVLRHMIKPSNCVARIVEIAIEPKSRASWEELSVGLKTLAGEDPSVQVATDFGSGQTVLTGISEQHLEATIDSLKGRFKVDINVGGPQVVYRETITRKITLDYTHKKFTQIKITVEPIASGTSFENKIVGGAMPSEYISGVEKGLESVLCSGVLAGFRVVDLKVTLVEVRHDLESSEFAFEIAARAALREALRQADPILLEPIMKFEVTTPVDAAAGVIEDLKRRCGVIEGLEAMRDDRVLHGLIPKANTFDYAEALSALTNNAAAHTLTFSHYAKVSHIPGDDSPFRPAIGMRA
jgi:elongation factor G